MVGALFLLNQRASLKAPRMAAMLSVSEWFGALILTEEEVVTALVLC